MSVEILTSERLFKLLEPVLGLKGRAVKKLSVLIEKDQLVEIDVTSYVRNDPDRPVAQPDFMLLDKLIAVVEGRDDQT